MLERLGRWASRIAFVVVIGAYIYDPIRRAKKWWRDTRVMLDGRIPTNTRYGRHKK